MKLLLFALGLFAVTASARGTNLKRSSAGKYGAAYIMTNEPSGNNIIASEILADGKLAVRRTIATNGVGGHVVSQISTDPFYSQGSIQISSHDILAVVNAGSSTISIFSIPKRDPTRLRQIGSPISSGGEYPVSVTFNRAGNVLCALNGGSVAGVSCFKVDETKGLTNITNTTRYLDLRQSTPPAGPFGSVSQVLFSADDKMLVVAVKGTMSNATFSHPAYLAIWDVNEDNSLSSGFRTIPAPSGALLPFSLTLIPGTDAVLASDAEIGYEIYTSISGRPTNPSNSPTKAYRIAGQKATCWTVLSNQTSTYYLTDFGTSIIYEVGIDDNLEGRLVEQYNLPEYSAPTEIAISTVNRNDYLYTLSVNATSIDVFKLNAPGKAAHTQRVSVKLPHIPIDNFNLAGMAIYRS
ncbi:hypothetical protein AX15_004590 [Amanita polypyramis BW_CC]|nr:hypothetical protein AX15_004590 [Amanita polypyramis BW_CC]